MPDGQSCARHGRAAIDGAEDSRQAARASTAQKRTVAIVYELGHVSLPRMAQAVFRLDSSAIVAVILRSALLIPILFGSD